TVREQEMDLTGWLEYFVEGLETQLEEVKERGKQAIQLDILATERRLNLRQVDALRHLLLQESMNIQDFERIQPSVARRTLQRDLKDLLIKGLITEIGQAATDPNRRYRMMFEL
ncbi:MAG: Fic family protein, partial [Anaerolineae bacterium]|nr:Fic family protein [Anaerolineae bacterium]